MHHSSGFLKFTQSFLLSLALIAVWSSPMSAHYSPQDAKKSAAKGIFGGIYGGIEIGSKGIKATAIRVTESEEGYKINFVYNELIGTALTHSSNNKLVPEAIKEIEQTVQQLYTRMKDKYKVPEDRIKIIVGSELQITNQEELSGAVKEKTGKILSFLDQEAEMQLCIAGAIPQRISAKTGPIDNRGDAVLVEIGNSIIKGGYSVIRQMSSATPDYDYVTFTLPTGTSTFTTEIDRAAGGNPDATSFAQKARTLGITSIRSALRKEIERKPGLINRQHVYLTGGIVRAMVTLLRPDDLRTFVPINADEIEIFYRQMTGPPESLEKTLNPDLTKRMPNPALRNLVEKEIESVRTTYSHKNLIAGAEILKDLVTEFNLSGKTIRFARYSQISWILSEMNTQTTL